MDDLICRTCESRCYNSIVLTSRSENFPDKTLADLLYELTKIDVSNDNCLALPQQLCGSCTNKLDEAYGFVKKARLVNEKLQKTLSRPHTDCLLEAPIDIPTQQYVQVKLEVDSGGAEDVTLFETFRDCLNAHLAEHKACVPLSDSNDKPADALEQIHADPITVTKNGAGVASARLGDNVNNISDRSDVEASCRDGSSNDSDSEKVPRRVLRSTQSSEAQTVKTELPAKRRPGRPRLYTLKANKEGRFVCQECGKTFAWHKDMQRHAKSHYASVSFRCEFCEKPFIRKDKYKDHMRMHQKENETSSRDKQHRAQLNVDEHSQPLGRFTCKLCIADHTSRSQLKQHLETHNDKCTLDNLMLSNPVVREHFFIDSLDNIKKLICEDIAAQRFEKYYAVLNADGYEMTLASSDDDCEVNDRYKCELCQKCFARTHQIQQHARNQHKSEVFPHQCNNCQQGFVCEKNYEQHMRTVCANQLKKYQCSICSVKFMWADNLAVHNCIGSKPDIDVSDKWASDQSGQSSTATSQKYVHHASNRPVTHNAVLKQQFIECCLCDMNFKKLKQLRKHLLMHQDDIAQIDIMDSIYFKTFYPAGCGGEEEIQKIRLQIAADLAQKNYALYYKALNTDGYELDLDDSDTTTDGDEEEHAQTEPYSCDVCKYKCRRRSLLMQHQKIGHADLQREQKLPHSCVDCTKQFVSVVLLVQHRRQDCLNALKSYQCEKCDTRFVWHANYVKHLSLKHSNPAVLEDSKDLSLLGNKLQCEHCDKVFVWLKDLTRHRRIHLPESEKFSCPHCERKFNRKDNMLSHMKVHNDEIGKIPKVPQKDMQLCKPHGCKRIECMICHTKHTKIADLRQHLEEHKFIASFPIGVEYQDVGAISQTLYPEIPNLLDEQQIIERIKLDITEHNFERYYSITNEAGYELSLDSSETDSDSDAELGSSKIGVSEAHGYTCAACDSTFKRKYQLYAHEQEDHKWEDAKFICVHCHARFINNQLLEHHYRMLCKNTQKRYICRKCPMRFRWKHNFKLHNDSHCSAEAEMRKKNSLTFECHTCNRTFQMQKDLTRHMFMHSRDAAIFICLWCPRKFYRNENLLQHIGRHGITPADLPYAEALITANKYAHGKKTIICKVCNLNFQRIKDLRNHLLSAPDTHLSYESMQNYSIINELGYEMHVDDSETDEEFKSDRTPGQYICELCQLVCRRKHELYRHQQAMHKQEKLTLKCEHCVYKCVSKHLLEHHERTQCGNLEKQHKCDKCSFKFMWPENLTQHLLVRHAITETAVATLADGIIKNELCSGNQSTNANVKHNIFQCTQCPRKYNRKDRLTAHIKKLHTPGNLDIANNSPAVAKKESSSEKRFLCAFCGKAVSSSSNLIIHMRRHTGEKPFKCDFCDMAFPRSSDMQCHRRTHTGEKPHKCTVCDKSFSRSYKLQQHMRIHNGERPYRCTYCDRCFTQSNDLTLHIRRHTGERPYVCGICGERFIQGTALKNHRIMRGHFEEVAVPARRTILEQFRVS